MDLKDRMIEAYERGETSYEDAYDYVREQDADRADARKSNLRSEIGSVQKLDSSGGDADEGEDASAERP